MKLQAIAALTLLSLPVAAAAQTSPSVPSPAVPPQQSAPAHIPSTHLNPRRDADFLSRPGYGFTRRADGYAFFVDSYRDALTYGRCAANISPNYAQRVVKADFGAPGEAADRRRLTGLSKGCLPAGTLAPIGFLRASLAETFYRDAVASGAALPAARYVSGVRTDADPLLLAAACLVRSAPANVDALLKSTPGTAAEARALDAAGREAPLCRSIARDAIAAPQMLRPFIAVEAYRRLTSPT